MSPYTGDQFMAGLNTRHHRRAPPRGRRAPRARDPAEPQPRRLHHVQPARRAAEDAGDRGKVRAAHVRARRPTARRSSSRRPWTSTSRPWCRATPSTASSPSPTPQIPRDLNMVSFRMNSQYIRPGCLDGMVGYAYNPATLPSGAQTYTTSTGQMEPVYDGNFSPRRHRPRRQLHAAGRGLPDQEADRPAGLQQPGALRQRLQQQRRAARPGPDAGARLLRRVRVVVAGRAPRRSSTPTRPPTRRSLTTCKSYTSSDTAHRSTSSSAAVVDHRS